MNGISHKQAIKWIHRRMDGLLNDRQLVELDEHLQSCDACRVYATNMDGLSAHLQNEFHRRWDTQLDPSQKVFEHVTTKASKLRVTSRIVSGTKLLAGAITLIVLAVVINFMMTRRPSTSPATPPTEIVEDTFLPTKRLLAFASYQDGNSDIYTMQADGSGLTNLTNHPADDVSPFWSPDGKRIVFTRHQDGLTQIYLMDADGSNVIQLTDSEGDYWFDINGYTPWSPDGNKMLFLHSSPEKKDYKLYSMDADGKNKIVLMNEPGVYLRPSWSADGEHVAFEHFESNYESKATTIPHLFVVDKNGNNLAEITGPRGRDGSAPFFLDYYWSQDGKSIFFMAGTRETIDIYKASLDGSLTVMTKSKRFIIDWWHGITLQTNENGRSLNWLRPDGSKSTLEVCPNGDLWHDQVLGVDYKRSYSGNLVFGSSCSPSSGWMLYWANPDGTITDKLLNSPISGDNITLFHMTWSPDDQFIAFVAMDDSPDLTDTLYVLDIVQARKDPSVQPLKMTGSYGPSWQPTP
jgi:TolB protein